MAVSLSLTLSESSVNRLANTSVVTATLKATTTGASHNGSSRSGYITIDGTKYSFSHSLPKNATTTLATKSKTVTHDAAGRKTVSVVGYFSTGISAGNMTTTASKTLTDISRQYTITLNNNGSTSTKVKTEGTNLALGTPTRTGYTFGGWWTGSGGTGTNYGTTLTADGTRTLYAKWTPATYTISFNANGGTGAPNSQTKTYGQALTLPSTVPTRASYAFAGWATSASGEVVYQAGSQYTNNADVTLYAVWVQEDMPPSISNLSVHRVNSHGDEQLSGEYVNISFTWRCAYDTSTQYGTEITAVLDSTSEQLYHEIFNASTDTSGTVSLDVEIPVENTDSVTITAVSNLKTVTETVLLPPGGVVVHIAPGENNVTLFGIADEDIEGLVVNNNITSQGLTINGKPMKNHVIKEGTSGNWRYRKWASGHMEAWGEFDSGTAWAGLSWTNGWYYSDTTLSIPTGFFSNAPSKVLVTTSTNQWMVFGAWANSSTQLGMRFAKPSSGAYTVTADIYLWGTAGNI